MTFPGCLSPFPVDRTSEKEGPVKTKLHEWEVIVLSSCVHIERPEIYKFTNCKYSYGRVLYQSFHHFFKKFLADTCPFGGHWYPCFGFLVMSPLGFEGRVGSVLFIFFRR